MYNSVHVRVFIDLMFWNYLCNEKINGDASLQGFVPLGRVSILYGEKNVFCKP